MIAILAALVVIPIVAIAIKSLSEHQSPSTKITSKTDSTNTTSTSGATNTSEQSANDLLKSGKTAFEKGDYVNANDQLKRALAISVLNKDHDTEYESQTYQGKILFQEGQFDAAKGAFYAVASAADNKDARPSDAQLAEAFNGLGEIQTLQGNYAKAEDDFQKALALRKKMDPKTAHIAQTLTGLGNLYLYQKQYKQALKYLTDAEKLSIEINGEKDRETAKIINDRGQAYQFLGKLSDADACYKKALEIRQSVLSPNDPAIASSKMCLGALAFAKRDFKTSEALFNDALRIDSAAFGEQNGTVAQIYFSLGVLFEQQKKYKEAVVDYQKAYDIQSKLLPPKDQKLQHTKVLLQQCKRKLGKG